MVNIIFIIQNYKVQSFELLLEQSRQGLNPTAEASKKIRESFVDKHGWYFDKDGVYSGLCFAIV